jgi:hypothetical protein
VLLHNHTAVKTTDMAVLQSSSFCMMVVGFKRPVVDPVMRIYRLHKYKLVVKLKHNCTMCSFLSLLCYYIQMSVSAQQLC